MTANGTPLNTEPLNASGTSESGSSAPFERLYPLRQSFEESDLESQLKALFMRVFESTLRASFDDLDKLGMPHLGSFDLIERSARASGLPVVRNNDPDAMRYLDMAWRSHCRARGLHFLKLYLQALWPGQWECTQLWQDESAPYPTALRPADEGLQYLPGHYLTSRVRVGIENELETPESLGRIRPALLAIIAYKFVLDLGLLRRSSSAVRVASLSDSAIVSTLTLDCRPAAAITASAVRVVSLSDSVTLSTVTLDCRPAI